MASQKIWATLVATTPTSGETTQTSVELNADIPGSTSDAISKCTMELFENTTTNFYDLIVNLNACIPYIENTTMGVIARKWVFENRLITFANVIPVTSEPLIPTVTDPTCEVDSITIPDGTTQLEVIFTGTCNLHHLDTSAILDVELATPTS